MTFTSIRSVLSSAASDFDDHNATRFSAALAFYTILSLAPLIILLTFAASRVFGSTAAENRIFDQLQSLIGRAGTDAIRLALMPKGQVTGAVVSSGLGLLTSLFGASGVFVEVRAALNAAWDIPPTAGNGLVVLLRERLFSFAVVIAAGLLLLAFLLFNAALSFMGGFLGNALPIPSVLLNLTNTVVSFLATSVVFLLMFKYLPEIKVLWRDLVLGSVVTALFFDLGKVLLGIYLRTMAVGSAYGAAGSVVVLTVWVYYSSMIFLFGAELTHVVAEANEKRGQGKR